MLSEFLEEYLHAENEKIEQHNRHVEHTQQSTMFDEGSDDVDELAYLAKLVNRQHVH